MPGVRATADAERLAEELGFAAGRLATIAVAPTGLYAEVASLAAGGDFEEATWLAFLIAYIGPLDGDDPWAGIEAARTTWASGELPDLTDVPLGPRSSHVKTRGRRRSRPTAPGSLAPARSRERSRARPSGRPHAASSASSSGSR